MNNNYKKGSIKLNNMEFYGHHGLTEAERKIKQLFVVNVSFECEMERAAREDDIESTVNYAGVYQICRKILEMKFKLIESIAYNIAVAIKNAFPEVENIEVSVSKPQVQLKGKIESAEVIYRL